jgi:nucleotide-binding universal stress UspA family protein
MEGPMFRHILVPTDGSSASLHAAQDAVDLAKCTGARITAFFAAPPATPIVFGEFLPTGYMPPDEHKAMLDRMTAKHLGAVERLATAAGVPFEGAHATSDYPAEAILAIAGERKCDLICMAPHAKHAVARALLGSQTQRVLAEAKISVLVVR